jgi:hypothetical protein
LSLSVNVFRGHMNFSRDTDIGLDSV